MSDFARRYRLEERIAVGGTAEVFHAVYFPGDDSQRSVVIKRVLPQFARDERFRKLFLEEACVAVTVSHPNIVKVLDHGELEQTCYIALEHVEGMDLAKFLARSRHSGRLPPANLAAFIVAHIGEALQFIHEQTSSEGMPLKIIHRDVSPQNILISYSGAVKLTDFGIAKSAIRNDTTVDGTLRGKLDYMAPEQAALRDVDSRADLFALGCVLFELLQGTPPFRGNTEIETLDRLRQGQIHLAPHEVNAPKKLQEVLTRTLETDPDQRYQTASDLVQALREFLAAESAAELRQALAQWACDLGKTDNAPAPDAIEDAVRKLMGESIAESADSSPDNPLGSTAVFARPSSSQEIQDPRASDPTLEILPSSVTSSGPRKPRMPLGLVLVACMGLVGWGLWATRYFSGASSPVASTGPQQVNRNPGVASTAPGRHRGRRPRAGATKTLRVRSSPSGAAVYVNQAFVGRTPKRIRLPAKNTIRLRIQKPGYRPWKSRLTRDRAPSAVTAILRPTRDQSPKGLLTINSLPWSRVYVDGVYIGNTPLVRKRLPLGRRRVELRSPKGLMRKRFTIDLTADKSQRRSFDFENSR